MGRRRRKTRKRQGSQQPAATTQEPKAEIVPWRKRMADVLAHLRDWSAEGYREAIEAWLAERFGDQAAGLGEADRRQAVDDFICSPGSAGDGSSILRVFCDHATGLEPEDRDQARRWGQERRRGVFVVQSARRDRLALWDPLEGAPLTLHLLEKLSAARLQVVGRRAVVTAVFQPWMARLVAVETEFFGDPRALQLFREEASASGTHWHEAPAPAPERGRGD